MADAAAPILRIRVVKDRTIVIGPGRADLLMHIGQTGSIAAAGRQMGMSYKRAWALVEAMNATFPTAVVEAAKGGVGGGGARLTPTGAHVLAAYRDLQQAATTAAAAALRRLDAALGAPLPVSRAVPRRRKTS